MGPDRAVIMAEIADEAIRGPDIAGAAPPDRPCCTVVVEGGARPSGARPMVRKLYPRAEPHVARSVHPESSRAGRRRRKGIPVLPVPAQDGGVTYEPHVSRAAPPDNRESLSRGNGNEGPSPRTTDALDHGSAIARPKREWEERKDRTQRGCAERSRASAARMVWSRRRCRSARPSLLISHVGSRHSGTETVLSSSPFASATSATARPSFNDGVTLTARKPALPRKACSTAARRDTFALAIAAFWLCAAV